MSIASQSPPADTAPELHAQRLPELAWLFLKLGTIAFGGPAAHIALMEDEVVRRRRWISHEGFLDLLGATNLIPGPNSTEMAIHIGYLRAGWRGLIVAGCCFILPAVLIVTAIAWAYVKFGKLPQVAAPMYGVKPVVIAIILHALWRLGRSAVKSPFLAAVAAGAAALSALHINELVVLFASAALVALATTTARRSKAQSTLPLASLGLPLAWPLTTIPAIVVAPSAGLMPLFLIFLKIGSVLFGSGYVLLAFLRADLVDRLHWLNETQLLDATAVGQITPGPVFTTATFIGYLLAGPKGAAVATIGIFLPAFVFVAISVPFIPRLRRFSTVSAFLDGLNVASLALMAVVTWQLGRATMVDPLTITLAAASAILLMVFRVNSTWLVAAGAAIGLISHRWR